MCGWGRSLPVTYEVVTLVRDLGNMAHDKRIVVKDRFLLQPEDVFTELTVNFEKVGFPDHFLMQLLFIEAYEASGESGFVQHVS